MTASVKQSMKKTRLVEIQRSKGYQTRPSFSVKQIGELISFVKSIKPDVICMVDNCYGEFVDTIEPSDVGADMIVGSLIKKSGAADLRLSAVILQVLRSAWRMLLTE